MRLIDADALQSEYMKYHDGKRSVLVDVAPTIDPRPEWIPTTERLPEIGEYVLCSQENGDVGEGKLLDYDGWFICYDQTCRGDYWVKAWMPFPDPYMEEKE